ncbi:MAG: hypothetical protein QOF09_4638 [Alphaproteobacteria bacterium]|jgi:hypothetical protein|nr:hypothetical protein [Alphaproteobacteria bacterium]
MRSVLLSAVLCVVVPAWAGPEFSAEVATIAIPISDSQSSANLDESQSLSQPEEVSAAKTSPDTEQASTFKKSELCDTVTSVAAANNIPVTFFANLIQQESGFKPYVVSRAGAQGIAQFMPRVAASYGLTDPFEPIAALSASGKLLAELVAEFGNIGLAAAAYNAGPRRVHHWIARKRKLPAETLHYVQAITGRPVEHWVSGQETTFDVRQRLTDRCFAIQAARPTTSFSAAAAPKRQGEALVSGSSSLQTSNKAAAHIALHSMPQPSQFAMGLPVSRFAAMAQPLTAKSIGASRSIRAKLHSSQQPSRVSILTMLTPKIMVEEEIPNRRKLSVHTGASSFKRAANGPSATKNVRVAAVR